MSDFDKEFFQRSWGEEGYYETFSYGVGGKVNHLTAIDVIAMPEKFREYQDFTYIELPDKSYSCLGVSDESIDFCFCYNVFCHLSNEALIKYLRGVHSVLKSGCDFVFMLSNYNKMEPQGNYQLGDLLPMGHFCQSAETVKAIVDKGHWEVLSESMIPEHRDIIVHLRKK